MQHLLVHWFGVHRTLLVSDMSLMLLGTVAMLLLVPRMSRADVEMKLNAELSKARVFGDKF